MLAPQIRLWSAELDLVFARRGAATVLTRRAHFGPLRVQKAMYPDGPSLAQLLIVHPPGGVAGGDRLSIKARVDAGAHALITTPGAGKWYKANGAEAGQDLRFEVGADASLEWLPQENIVFDGARARWTLDLQCLASSRVCGWEIVALGRHASGEHFASGYLGQQTRLVRDGRLLWSERGYLDGNDPVLASATGWAGDHVCGTLWALGLPNDESLLQACRQQQVEGVRSGVTRLPNGLMLARALGRSPERLRGLLADIWACLRPALNGRAAAPPRIWAT